MVWFNDFVCSICSMLCEPFKPFELLEPTIEPEHCSLEPFEPFEPTIEPEHCSLEPLEPLEPF